MTEHVSIPGNEESMRAKSIVAYYLPDELLEFMKCVHKTITTNE